jgi:beta-1,2-mannobiose phosphorylase / 1,2-beta-oligomannan phosphorylase
MNFLKRKYLFSSAIYIVFILIHFATFSQGTIKLPSMYYSDSGVNKKPYAKDPYVVYFNKKYYMYYSIPGPQLKAWYIGIATSKDLINWKKEGDIKPVEGFESKGICAPSCIVRDGQLHIFYQTYGNGKKDAICHAVSSDGLHFQRDASNPIFKPTGKWNIGRAIDAEVVFYKNQYFLYFATRDSSYTIQQQGVAVTTANSNFNRDSWAQLSVDSAILKPQLPWETKCIEAASCIVKDGFLYMFYAGGYNNEPQQISVAKSTDGLHWQRLFNEPLLVNGKQGTWNESESGHPNIFKDQKGKYHLFFQGNNDKGNTWYLSKVEIGWNKKGPFIIK